MAALHDALKTLGPTEFSQIPLDDLKGYMSKAFNAAQTIVESIPIPSADSSLSESRSRSNTTSSSASSASEISISSARSAPPPPDIEALQKEWKPVKLNPKENPLGMSVYKLGGKDGRGAWFARRSVHEGLGFMKWKRGLEREFPETMKVKGPPGEGNIRGIGGERWVEFKSVDGMGNLEVYLLTAQFPGPTTPRDFVTMLITSDQALSDQSNGEHEVPRHFMVISKPCIHPETPPREGFIRGQYESVEFIREIPIKKPMKKSASSTNLTSQSRNRSGSMLSREAVLRNAKQNHSPPADENGTKEEEKKRARGKTISFDKSRGADAKGEDVDVPREDEEYESNPVEWIMVTRSDPGGSVPRFMIERGTPGGIVADASKFLNWACAKDIEDFESDDEADGMGKKHKHNHEKVLHEYQTNGHLAGIDEAEAPESSKEADAANPPEAEQPTTSSSGIYSLVTGVAGAATGYIASHTPAIISSRLPGQADSQPQPSPSRRISTSSTTSSSVGSFTSALEQSETLHAEDESLIQIPTTSSSSQNNRTISAAQEKELQKLEEKKRKLAEKLTKAREKEASKTSEDSVKEEEALRKVEEKHDREVKKQEERYKKEVEKLERKKEKEERKAEERRRRAVEKDEKTRLVRELEEVNAELGVLRKEKEILSTQVGDLQRENTALVGRVGRLGVRGEEVLREVRGEVLARGGGRERAKSLMGLKSGGGGSRPASVGSGKGSAGGSRERERLKENIKEGV